LISATRRGPSYCSRRRRLVNTRAENSVPVLPKIKRPESTRFGPFGLPSDISLRGSLFLTDGDQVNSVRVIRISGQGEIRISRRSIVHIPLNDRISDVASGSGSSASGQGCSTSRHRNGCRTVTESLDTVELQHSDFQPGALFQSLSRVHLDIHLFDADDACIAGRIGEADGNFVVAEYE